MSKRKYEKMEKVLVYLAEKSVGKSIPITLHKIQKPKKIEDMVKSIKGKVD